VGAASGVAALFRNALFLVPHALKTPVFDLAHRFALGWTYSPPPLTEVGLYERIIGRANFHALHPVIQKLHSSGSGGRLWGTARVQSTWLSRLMGLPPSYEGPFELHVERQAEYEVWRRQFGAHFFDSIQWTQSRQLLERFGPMRFVFDLKRDGATMQHVLFSASMFGVPIPRFLQPAIGAVSKGSADGKRFEAAITVLLFSRQIFAYNLSVAAEDIDNH
jgi:hypothetical protein